MGLFSKKPKVRFETITIDRETEVFRALENKGWILCDDPFQFDLHKPPEKLRRDAMSVAKDLRGELIVEIYDPIYVNMPWKGLRYAVWRRATPDEIRDRIAKQQAKARPNYKDTMGSYDDIHRQLDQKRIHISEEDLHALDDIKVDDDSGLSGDSGGKQSEELRMANEAIKAISSFDPYEHQGEYADEEAESKGPVFEERIELQADVPDATDPSEDIDAMDMMMSEGQKQPAVPQQEGQVPVESEKPQPPANQPPASPPANTQKAQPPARRDVASPPANVQKAQLPANQPPARPPANTQQAQPPAQTQKAAPPAQQPSDSGFKAPPPPPNNMVGKRDEDED
jgi:hypothetical protein